MLAYPGLVVWLASPLSNQGSVNESGHFCVSDRGHLSMRMLALGVVILFQLANSTAIADDCGKGGRCLVDKGYYLAEQPEDWDGKSSLPLVVFFHGWNSSPEGMFRNRALVDGITSRGALFVAPWAQTGYWRQIGEGRAEGGRDELAYTAAVMADIRQR